MTRCPCTCEMRGEGTGRGELAFSRNAFCACPFPLSVPVLAQCCGLVHLNWHSKDTIDRGDQIGNVTIPLRRTDTEIMFQKGVDQMHMEPRT